MAIAIGIGAFLLVIFMMKIDRVLGNFMGMIVVLGIIGFAIVAVMVIAGAFIIPILFAIAVPVFIFWFVYWSLKQLFGSPERQVKKIRRSRQSNRFKANDRSKVL